MTWDSARVAINLAATDRLQQIAQAVGVTFTFARQAAAEVGHLRDPTDKGVRLVPIDLSQYDVETLEIIDLTPAEYRTYVNLARMVNDGEAATITLAVERGLQPATDDRKARRVCAELQIPEPLRRLAFCTPTPTPHAYSTLSSRISSSASATEQASSRPAATRTTNGGMTSSKALNALLRP